MDKQNFVQVVPASLASATDPVALRLYAFQSNPERRDAYFQYYQDKIIPWLKRKGVTDAKVWTVERGDIFLFAIACSPEDPPWDDPEIPELGGFLDVMDELRFTARPSLGIPPN